MTTTTKETYLPAEWEQQSAVMLTWPHGGTDWNAYLYAITQTYLEMVRAISATENVVIAAQYADDVRTLLENALTADSMKRVSIYRCENNDTWARDHGPVTLIKGDGSLEMLNFRFNGWGNKFEAALDNGINAALARQGAFDAEMADNDDFVLEGGSIESDGKGTVFTTSTCLLAPHRNQPMTRDDIERRLKSTLHAKRIVWLDHGELTGDDTDGHIDTIVRCAPDDTLVYVGCDDTGDEQYDDFKALEQQLMTLTTADGKPYRLIRLPMPDAEYYDGERLPATYANFLIINGGIIMPTYGNSEKDEEARKALQEAFPHHRITGIDSRIIIRQHGSIHCLTMQIPERRA